MAKSYCDSAIGIIEITGDELGITGIRIVEDISECDENEWTKEAKKQLEQYFNYERKSFELLYHLEGTSFQKKVWKESVKIGYGEIKSYQDIAILLGDKNKARAVGMALHHNPLLIVIPCHRIIGKNKQLIGYREGVNIKKYLLEMEEYHAQI